MSVYLYTALAFLAAGALGLGLVRKVERGKAEPGEVG